MVLDNGRGTGDYGNIRRVAMISVHTSPLATLGEKDAGGLNVYVRELSRHLGRRGVAVDLFTRRSDPALPDVVALEDGVRVVHIGAGPPTPLDKGALFGHLGLFASEMALFALRDGVGYDVVHGHYWLSGWAAHLLRRFWAAPTVQMFHTLARLKQGAAAGAADGDEPELRVRTERRIMDTVDAIVAANARERAEIGWWYGVRTPKIHTISPGIDLDRFAPRDRAAARGALGFGSEPMLLYVGRIDPAKGVDFLIDGFAALRERWTGPMPPRLVLVGGELHDGPDGPVLGPDLARLRDRAVALGVAEAISFRGPQPHAALPDFYAAADLTVVPSRYESFGLVAVESLACGTPVVASRVGGLAFTMEEGRNGWLVPYGDVPALAVTLDRALTALADEATRARLSTGAVATAGRFGWSGVTDKMLALYGSLSVRPAMRGDAAAVGAGD